MSSEKSKRFILANILHAGLDNQESQNAANEIMEQAILYCHGNVHEAESLLADVIAEINGISEPIRETEYGSADDFWQILQQDAGENDGHEHSQSADAYDVDDQDKPRVSILGIHELNESIKKLIPEGPRCYSVNDNGNKIMCPYFETTDYGVVRCSYLNLSSVITDNAELYLKAIKHFGSEEALDDATRSLLLCDMAKECGINE